MDKDLEDALEWGQMLNRVLRGAEARGEIDPLDITSPKPDPDHPGQVMLTVPGIREKAKGGIVYGYVDCRQCGEEFFFELALTETKHPIHSLGGVWSPPDVWLCDRCSPI